MGNNCSECQSLNNGELVNSVDQGNKIIQNKIDSSTKAESLNNFSLCKFVFRPQKQSFSGEFHPDITINQQTDQSLLELEEIFFCSNQDATKPIAVEIKQQSASQHDFTSSKTNQKPQINIKQKVNEKKKEKQYARGRSESAQTNRPRFSNRNLQHDSRKLNQEIIEQKAQAQRKATAEFKQQCSKQNLPSLEPSEFDIRLKQFSISQLVNPILKRTEKRRSRSMTPLQKRVRFSDTVYYNRKI